MGTVAMDLLTWLFVGLGAGVLAALIVGGVGLFGDMIVGIIGAFASGLLFRELAIAPPFPGVPGVIFTAGIGAVVLLALLHLVAGRRSSTI
jgi:uncharacterized membrane protein YeaQ/YmgE (transglycosylase-associated protein family)